MLIFMFDFSTDEANLEQRIAEETLEFDDWVALFSEFEKRYAVSSSLYLGGLLCCGLGI